MKRILLVFLTLPLLSGCTILNTWCIKGDGKALKGAYQMINASADRVDAIFIRTLLITTQKVNKDFLNNLPLTKITVSDDNKSKDVSVGPSAVK